MHNKLNGQKYFVFITLIIIFTVFHSTISYQKQKAVNSGVAARVEILPDYQTVYPGAKKRKWFKRDSKPVKTGVNNFKANDDWSRFIVNISFCWIEPLEIKFSEKKFKIIQFNDRECNLRDYAFLKRNRTVSVGSEQINLWSGKNLKKNVHDKNRDRDQEMYFSADADSSGTMFVTGSKTNKVTLWNLKGEIIKEMKGHRGWVFDAEFTSTGKIISASADSTVRLWDLKGNLLKIYREHRGAVEELAISSKTGDILTGSHDDGLLVLRDSEGKKIKHYRPGGRINAVALNPRGKLLASSSDRTIWILNRAGKKLHRLKAAQYFGKDPFIDEMTFSPSGRIIIASEYTGPFHFFDTETGKHLATMHLFWDGSALLHAPGGRYQVTGKKARKHFKLISTGKKVGKDKLVSLLHDPELYEREIGPLLFTK